MSKARILKSFTSQSIRFLASGLLVAAASLAAAQSASQSAMLALPDSPGAVRASADSGGSSSSLAESAIDSPADGAPARQKPMAAPSDMYISPGQQAPQLSVKDKFAMGAKDSISPFSIAAWFTSAGWAQLTNVAPNYGTDKGAFGQRLGAAAIRDVSEDFLSTAVMASAFHQDPRYYKLGRHHRIGRRIVYAATRAIITRSDSGRMEPNYSLLAGNLAGSILTNAYYPPANHGFKETMEIFGGSVGGSALGFGISEFLSDGLAIVHLKKSE